MSLPLFEFIITLVLTLMQACLFAYCSLSTINNLANIIVNNISIPMLNVTNFKSWHKKLLIVLGVMDLNLELKTDSSSPLIDQNTFDEKRVMER